MSVFCEGEREGGDAYDVVVDNPGSIPPLELQGAKAIHEMRKQLQLLSSQLDAITSNLSAEAAETAPPPQSGAEGGRKGGAREEETDKIEADSFHDATAYFILTSVYLGLHAHESHLPRWKLRHGASPVFGRSRSDVWQFSHALLFS